MPGSRPRCWLSIHCSEQLAAVGIDQRVIVTQQFEYLQQRLLRQPILVASITLEQLQQAVQSWLVLLACQLLNAQLIGRLIILRVLRQAAFQVGHFR
ncbi:hypothetical protein D3C80_893330 [compost metagenome]